jgi:membrane protease YdiL (CAAX protease family)
MNSESLIAFEGNIFKKVFREAKSFSSDLLENPPFLAMSAMFIIGKIVVNLYMGAKAITALRSGVLGFILYMLACYFIHIYTAFVKSPQPLKSTNISYIVALIGWVILTIGVISLIKLNNIEFANFRIPLWSALNDNWNVFVNNLVQRYEWIEGTGLIGWPYLILYVLIPLLITLCFRMKLPLIIGWKQAIPALPFVLVYLIGFISIKGISEKNIATLVAILIWPAFGEEFLYRAILQQALLGVVKKPVTAIVLTSLLFTASHIPGYVIAASGPAALEWSALLPIMLTSFFWGYGYYRTDVLWPWVLIHAFSNLL